MNVTFLCRQMFNVTFLCRARNGRQSSQIALYAFFFRRLIFGTGSPVLAAHRRGVFGSLDCFAGFFAALAGAPLTSVVYYLILNE